MAHNSSTQVRWVRRKRKMVPYLLMAPGIIAVLVAVGYPMVKQFIMSFQKFGLAQQFGKSAPWVGLDNYKTILTDTYFWQVFGRSLAFCIVTAGLTMILSILFAVVLLHAGGFGRGFLNSTLIVVWGMPLLASLTVWQWLIDPNYGPVNYVLTKLGADVDGYNWLSGSPWTFFAVASLLITWASIPMATISIYAAMAQVPGEVIEAADMDSATNAQITRYVLLPSAGPIIALMTVLQVIWDLKVFTQIYVLQQSGGVTTETNLLGTYVFQTGIAQGNYGIASALATVILVLTLLLSAGYIRMLLRQGDAA
ncbi:carbohydrate ABC transporter permease [Cutibacterium sp.]|uniref:carbohydrate ABC transporter permease n=1 Tax=Cutibacterium sp. TaxID=1912221 RepID=UPI0026DBBB7D|nr:sugar ABC transporter permease [Cutibacterium sp.]MDO4412745.1 sugar ABC transporter permease [Cutibacterium sp.]